MPSWTTVASSGCNGCNSGLATESSFSSRPSMGLNMGSSANGESVGLSNRGICGAGMVFQGESYYLFVDEGMVFQGACNSRFILVYSEGMVFQGAYIVGCIDALFVDPLTYSFSYHQLSAAGKDYHVETFIWSGAATPA